jgi:hypothetical protein
MSLSTLRHVLREVDEAAEASDLDALDGALEALYAAVREHVDTEARWERGRERQRAYRASPEAQAARADRIATGQCVIEERRVCVTHGNTEADFGHYLAHNPVATTD